MKQGKISLWQQYWPYSAHNTARKTLAQLVVRSEWEAIGHFYGASSVINRNQFAVFTPDFIDATIKRILNKDDFADGSTFFQVLLKHPRHRDLCIASITESFATDFEDDIFENASDFIDLLADMPAALQDGPIAQLTDAIAHALYDHHAAHSRTFSVAEFEDLGKLWGKLNHLAPDQVKAIICKVLDTTTENFDIDDAIKALEIAHEGGILPSIPQLAVDSLIDYCTDEGMPSALYSTLWFKASGMGAKESRINPYKPNLLNAEEFTLVPLMINRDDALSVLFRHHAKDPAKAAVIDNVEHPDGDDTRPMVSVGNISMPDFLTRLLIDNTFMCSTEMDEREIDFLKRVTDFFNDHATGRIGTVQTATVARRVLPIIEQWCIDHKAAMPAYTPNNLS